MTYPSAFFSLTGTQAGGAVTKEIPELIGGRRTRHTFMAEALLTSTGVVADAVSGKLIFRVKILGIQRHQEIGEISLTSPNPVFFEGHFISVEVESQNFDSDKTWSLCIESGE